VEVVDEHVERRRELRFHLRDLGWELEQRQVVGDEPAPDVVVQVRGAVGCVDEFEPRVGRESSQGIPSTGERLELCEVGGVP